MATVEHHPSVVVIVLPHMLIVCSAACRPHVPSFLVSLKEVLQIGVPDAARIVTAAVAAQIRGILLEASAAQKRESTHSARWDPVGGEASSHMP